MMVLRSCLVLATYLLAGGLTLLAQSYGLGSRSPFGAYMDNRLPTRDPNAAGGWAVVDAFPNLTFEDPIFLTHMPGTDRLVVCGRQGIIWSFQNNPSTTTKAVLLDIRARTQGWESCGLMGIAFHPEFRQAGSPNRGYIYVYYHYSANPTQGPARPSVDTPGYNRLSRFTIPDGSLIADPNTELVLVDQYDRHIWHNGGTVFFGPDGFLYFCNGDEGGANDEFNASQRLDGGLFGGVFRIDVDRNPSRSHPIRRQPRSGSPTLPGSFSGNYYIPNDNPFQDPSGGILEEYFALGLRSPHKMSLDPVTGEIWLGDVGQETWEEVSIIRRGGNYQWPYREGAAGGPKAAPFPIIGTDSPPLYTYIHSGGDNAVIGGYIYRGTTHRTQLEGQYIFGDNGSGRIFAIQPSPFQIRYLATLDGHNYEGLSSFGIDAAGELYMCQLGAEGKIRKLVQQPVPPEPAMPARLSQLGIFSNLSTLQVVPAFIPFDVNTPLWSDDALKTRWLAVPNDGAPYGANERITFSPTSEWAFPSGSVFVKHFELPVDQTNPSIKRRLETRVLVRDRESGVYGFTYRWRTDGSDADLVTEPQTETITIRTASGNTSQTWYYPGPRDCLSCHNANAGGILGIKTHQINRPFTYPQTGVTDNQLRAWNHVELFTPSLSEGSIPGYPRAAAIEDTSASLELRVKSYLDANCAQCHRPNGGQSYFDARFNVPMASQAIINGMVVNHLGISNAKVVAPQDLPRSVLYLRMNSLSSAIKMPPLAKNKIDTKAVNLISEWIQSLPPSGSAPTEWSDADIGFVGLSGYSSVSGDTFTVVGAGDDIWNQSDAFHYLYQPFSGDGEIIARVLSVQHTDNWAKAGIMFRESLQPNARNVMVKSTASHGLGFQYRDVTGGNSSYIAGPFLSPPAYLRLVRQGSTFTGYSSEDGISWRFMSSVSIPLPNSIYVGLAVTSHNREARNASTFSNIRITGGGGGGTPMTVAAPANLAVQAQAGPRAALTWTDQSSNEEGFYVERSTGGAFTRIGTVAANTTSFNDGTVQSGSTYTYRVQAFLGTTLSAYSNTAQTTIPEGGTPTPTNWSNRDVGPVGVAGSASVSSAGQWSIAASGSDIWGTTDGFHYVYQPWTGDGVLIARFTQLENTDNWAKAGLMFRATLDASSANVLAMVTAAHGAGLQARPTAGVSSRYTAGPSGGVPVWLKLERRGSTFLAFRSSDGQNWTQYATETVALPSTLYAGIAVTSHRNTMLNNARAESLLLQSLDGGTPAPTPPAAPSGLTATATSSSEIQLNWSDNSGNEDGFYVERSTSGGTFVQIASLPANTTEYRNTGLSSGTTYAYRVRAHSSAGTSSYSNTASATPSAVQGLPVPWLNRDIGSPALPGSASHSGGTFRIRGAGTDIWNRSDQFQFVYQSASGDAELIARMDSLQNTDSWAKVGLMFRADLSPGAAHTMVFLTPVQGVGYQRRATSGGDCIYVRGPSASAPLYLRLRKRGTTVEAFTSSNGSTWTLFHTETVSLPTNFYMGMAVTSHNPSQVTESLVSTVQALP